MRKLATAAAVSLVLASGSVKALGLGDIEMRSSLNQPMNAEIRLTSVKPGEANGMIVKLASAESFSRAGIDRTSALTDLRFAVDQSTGTPVIRISSDQPITEPFLNFLLEVDWPAGRMVREYTVLLDPPVFMTPSANNASTDQAGLLPRSDAQGAASTIQRDTVTEDGFEVELVGSGSETSDSALPAAIDGDLIELETVDLNDALGDLGGAAPVLPESFENADEVSLQGVGDAVALTDLAVGNPDAAAQFNADQFAGGEYDFQVEMLGNSTEVSDSFVADGGSFSVGVGDIASFDESNTDLGISGGGGEVTVQRGDTLAEIAQANAVQGVSSQQMMIALLNANQSAFIDGNVNLVKAGAILRIPDGSQLSQISQSDAVALMGEQDQLWREYRDNVRGTSGTRVASNTRDNSQNTSRPNTQLSDAAQRILSAAQDETLGRKELNIVAESDSTTTAASATADNSEASASAQMGEINKRIQLAKEELASTRLESVDLVEQSAELQSTTENMDSLVGIRQQEVARLEEQLRRASGEEVGFSADTDAMNAGVDELPGVELVDDMSASADMATASQMPDMPAQSSAPWYTTLLQNFGTWIVVGLGIIGAILAGLFLLSKRRNNEEEEFEYSEDDVNFFDEDDDVQFDADSEFASVDGGTAAAAGVAGGGAAAAAAYADNPIAGGYDADALEPDADDTISEVDVYLAYGLHGQAEELLVKATEREPDNAMYALKLLQTQHAQGNPDEFAKGAEDYFERFGGEDAPEWSSVCEMGYELQPNNAMFASTATAVSSVGSAPDLGDSDFQSDGEGVAGSVSRDFGAGADGNESDLMDQSIDPALAFDETDLEATGDFTKIADEIASEEAAGNADSLLDDTSIDMPGLDAGDSLDTLGDDFGAELNDDLTKDLGNDFGADFGGDLGDELGSDFGEGLGSLGDKASDAGSSLKSGLGAGIGAAAAGGAAVMGGLGSKAADAKDSASDFLDDGLSLENVDVGGAANDGLQDLSQSTISEDLTLDLDQLSGDLELDGNGLDDGLEMPDLTSNNELLSDNANDLDSSDEMDTMMDLAKAYIDMGDNESASSALGEIVKSGNPAQVSEASALLKKIS